MNLKCLLLTYQDSNLDRQYQKLLCYHYTIGQLLFEGAKVLLYFYPTKKFFKIFTESKSKLVLSVF